MVINVKKTALITAIILAICFSAFSVNAAEIHRYPTLSDRVKTQKAIKKSFRTSDSSLPSKYSSKDLGYCTSVKDQIGSTCWSYASLSSYETILLMKGLFSGDLSVPALDLWGTTQSDGNGWIRDQRQPGSTYIPIGNFTSWSGPLKNEGDTPTLGVTELTYLDKGDFSGIKKAVMRSGAVTANLLNYTRAYSKNRNCYCLTDEISHNEGHTVSIVGWDDNFDKSNFDGNYTPENDGAWLCKNSWGTAFNQIGGYCWISYEDFYLLSNDYFDPSFAIDKIRVLKNTDHIYQNEIYGATYEFSYIKEDDITYFNVFDFSEDGNVLEKVVFESTAVGAGYKVYSVPLNNNDKPVPDENKWTLLGEGTIDHNGYICCETGNKILRRNKQAIAVQINTEDTDSENSIGVSEWLRDIDTKEMIFQCPVEEGKSYVTFEGAVVDIKDYYADEMDDNIGGTLVIKAITNRVTKAKYLGDIDLNSTINIKDATQLQKYLADIIKLSDDAKNNADFNTDGKINIKDATAIQRSIAKMD